MRYSMLPFLSIPGTLLLVPLFAVSLKWFSIYPPVDSINHRPLKKARGQLSAFLLFSRNL